VIPTGIATVVAFFFFVIPGLVWELLVERRRPAKAESAFREASRVALVSTPFSTISVGIVFAAAWLCDQHWLTVLSSWFTTGKPQSGEALIVASLLAVAELGVALLLLGLVWWRVGHRLYGMAKVEKESAWGYAFGHQPAGHATVATVRTHDGSEYRGQVVGFTNDFDWADREIILTRPLSVSRSPGTLVAMPEQLVTIPSASISAISSIFVSLAELERSGGPVARMAPKPAPRQISRWTSWLSLGSLIVLSLASAVWSSITSGHH
jgi:hypothetical protein